MKVKLKINRHTTQFEQMAQAFYLEPINNRLIIPEALGHGFVEFYDLPYEIQVHHYAYNLKKEIEVQGENKEEDGLYMININLSNRLLDKKIGDNQMRLSKAGGSGALFYSPGFNSQGKNELNVKYEILFFAFPKETFQMINTINAVKELSQIGRFCIYDELSPENERLLNNWLAMEEKSKNPFVANGLLLQVLGKIVNQFANRETSPSSKLNIQDVQRQFMVKELIIQNIYGNLPTLEEIAQQIYISPSKLKTDFKSVFGKSVYQFYLSKKMETARQLLMAKKGTIAEIGHELGYSNTSQFSAQFKKHFGVNPSKL